MSRNLLKFNYKDIFDYTDVFVSPSKFGEIRAQKDLEEFKEYLIEVFNDEDVIFEQRTREALERVESSGIKGKPASEFLKEMDLW